jgi:hypothetical protein
MYNHLLFPLLILEIKRYNIFEYALKNIDRLNICSILYYVKKVTYLFDVINYSIYVTGIFRNSLKKPIVWILIRKN